MSVYCQYCNKPATLVPGNVIYPHRRDLSDLKFWNCSDCNAYVGTHKNSKNNAPLGTLANAQLRRMRNLAHAAFDPIWKSGRLSRGKAYQSLGYHLGITDISKKCHIALFNEEQCKKVIEVSEKIGE